MLVYELIAQFLKDKNYTDTLALLEREYGKAIPTDTPFDESLEDIVTDRINFKNMNDNLDRLNLDFVSDDVKNIVSNQIHEWTSPYPQISVSIPCDFGLVVTSCLINYGGRPLLFIGTAHMEFVVIDLNQNKILLKKVGLIGKVVIKKIISLKRNEIIVTGMNGRIYWFRFDISDMQLNLSLIEEFQVHSKLVTDIKSIEFNGDTYIFSLGWDFHLKVFQLIGSSIRPVTEIRLKTQGTCFDVTEYKGNIVLVLGKIENTLLEVYNLKENILKLVNKISLNDAEFTSSGFTPRCLSIQKVSDNVPLVAVGTSHEPYMRLIIVPLKEVKLEESNNTIPILRNQIIRNINTLSPQDKYSQSLLSWRPSNGKSTGVWVIGEDGNLRGIDLQKGKKLIELVGHDGNIKTFASGIRDHNNEVLVTFGIDRNIKLWTQ